MNDNSREVAELFQELSAWIIALVGGSGLGVHYLKQRARYAQMETRVKALEDDVQEDREWRKGIEKELQEHLRDNENDHHEIKRSLEACHNELKESLVGVSKDLKYLCRGRADHGGGEKT